MKNLLKNLFARGVSKQTDDHVCSFNEDREKEEDVRIIDHGIRTVALDQITGSVGRYADFDSRFRPKRHVASKRLEQIKQTMRDGGPLAPVQLYQIRDTYYVLDGNHRVAAAKELGWTEILASVVELLSGQTTIENLIYIEKKQFFEKTGLKENIALSEIGKYRYLEKQIEQHKTDLEQASGQAFAFEKAAKDWYNTVFVPMTVIISGSGLDKHFPGRTIADLYAYISYHHWEENVERRYGIGIGQVIPRTMAAFRQAMLEKNTPEYPEMKRTITAFVFINLNSCAEIQIIDRLFSLEEIQEVHSVHGSIDILVKLVLQRDFLTSDAETIGEFVENHIRRLDGVARTQTVIPGLSKVKPGFIL